MLLRFLMPMASATGCAAPLAAACACGASMVAQGAAVQVLGASATTTVVVTAAAALGALAGFVLWWTEWRWAWLRRLFALLLFSRISADEVDQHDTRAQLLAEVRSKPSQDTRQLAQVLGMNVGTLLYHLRVLERSGRVHSRRVGRLRVWEATGRSPDPKLDALQDDSRQALWMALRQSPGCSAAEVAQRLGLSRGTIHHHVGYLARVGLVRIERHGNRTRLFAVS